MVRVRQRKGRTGFQVDIHGLLPNGTRYRERVKPPVSSYSAALRWGQQREAVIIAQGGRARHSEPGPTRKYKDVPTLAAFKDRFVVEHLRAEQRKPSSIEAAESLFRTHLGPALGGKRLDEIELADVQTLKAKSLEQLTAKTTNNILSTLGSMLRRAVEWGVIESFPRFRLLKTSGRGALFYDFADYARLVGAAHALDPRIEVMVLLGGDAGLRRGEIMALEWTDLDFRRQQVHVQRSEWSGQVTTPKGGRSRIVPMTEELCRALQVVRHLRGPRVLYRDDGSSLTNKVVRLWMLAAQRRAGLPVRNGGTHILRHTFCSHLAMQGAAAKAIQELAGHSTLAMTQRYMHLSPAAKDSAIALLNARPVESPNARGTRLAPEAVSQVNPNDVG
ncbi:MAG TPA: tyrosine-type recombinase/integrase [Anaeromyxobacteraceae bacterium]|nr:tyrosine-type recombinase/integrase [Anaeromyxobacteraceae bacterium]